MSDLGYSTVGDELLANARLIAVAPEMLDLLIEVCISELPEERLRCILKARKIIGRVGGDDQ